MIGATTSAYGNSTATVQGEPSTCAWLARTLSPCAEVPTEVGPTSPSGGIGGGDTGAVRSLHPPPLVFPNDSRLCAPIRSVRERGPSAAGSRRPTTAEARTGPPARIGPMDA